MFFLRHAPLFQALAITVDDFGDQRGIVVGEVGEVTFAICAPPKVRTNTQKSDASKRLKDNIGAMVNSIKSKAQAAIKEAADGQASSLQALASSIAEKQVVAEMEDAMAATFQATIDSAVKDVTSSSAKAVSKEIRDVATKSAAELDAVQPAGSLGTTAPAPAMSAAPVVLSPAAAPAPAMSAAPVVLSPAAAPAPAVAAAPVVLSPAVALAPAMSVAPVVPSPTETVDDDALLAKQTEALLSETASGAPASTPSSVPSTPIAASTTGSFALNRDASVFQPPLSSFISPGNKSTATGNSRTDNMEDVSASSPLVVGDNKRSDSPNADDHTQGNSKKAAKAKKTTHGRRNRKEK
jgi:hypothetical protein